MNRTPIARIAELWRYPVKSMRGEQVSTLEVLSDGIAHDRRYAFLSSRAPVGKPRLTSRERAALLRYTARVIGDTTMVTTPEHAVFPVDGPAFLAHLQSRLPQSNSITLEHDPAAAPYTDVRPVAIISTKGVARLASSFGRNVNALRFRANLVLEFGTDVDSPATTSTPPGLLENALSGRTLLLGPTCRLRILEQIPRCRVVTLDPDTTEPDPSLMKHLDRHFGGRFGVYAAVDVPGILRVQDVVTLLESDPTPAPSLLDPRSRPT